MYIARTYRQWSGRKDLARFQVTLGESDLHIQCDTDLQPLARTLLQDVRSRIEHHIAADRTFATTLVPHPIDAQADVVVKNMGQAARFWRVGPMAAVAGAVAQFVGEGLRTHSRNVIVENGGDLYVRTEEPVTIAIYAGEASPFTDKLRFRVDAQDGIGVCTSSATVGPSLSFGHADAVVAIADDAVFADAAATAIANRVKAPRDVANVVAAQRRRGALRGLIVCCGDQLGLWGDFELLGRDQEAA